MPKIQHVCPLPPRMDSFFALIFVQYGTVMKMYMQKKKVKETSWNVLWIRNCSAYSHMHFAGRQQKLHQWVAGRSCGYHLESMTPSKIWLHQLMYM